MRSLVIQHHFNKQTRGRNIIHTIILIEKSEKSSFQAIYEKLYIICTNIKSNIKTT